MAETEGRLNALGKKAGGFARQLGGSTGLPDPKSGAGAIEYIPVRSSPKGTRLETQTEDTVVLRFRAAIRFWWMLPYVLLGITAFGSLPLGLFIGTYMNPSGYAAGFNQFFSASLFWTPVVLLGLTIFSWYATTPWVTVVANRKHILVGPYYFSRDHYSGVRIGYEIQTTSGILKNGFDDLSLGLQGIRVGYGPWGEDLPYLVNKYHASEIVLWLNFKSVRRRRLYVRPFQRRDSARKASNSHCRKCRSQSSSTGCAAAPTPAALLVARPSR